MKSGTSMREVMTPFPHTIGADQMLHLAKKRMYSEGIRHLPVLEGGHCVGILSDRDVKLAYAVDGAAAEKLKVQDVCSNEVYTVSPNDSIQQVALHMAEHGMGSAVVLEGNKVLGIFTTTDALKLLAQAT